MRVHTANSNALGVYLHSPDLGVHPAAFLIQMLPETVLYFGGGLVHLVDMFSGQVAAHVSLQCGRRVPLLLIVDPSREGAVVALDHHSGGVLLPRGGRLAAAERHPTPRLKVGTERSNGRAAAIVSHVKIISII